MNTRSLRRAWLAALRCPAEMPTKLEQSPTSRVEALHMITRLLCLVAILSATSAVMLFAQEGTTKAEGTLMLDKKNYSLKHALAYETTIDNEQAIVVVFS